MNFAFHNDFQWSQHRRRRMKPNFSYTVCCKKPVCSPITTHYSKWVYHNCNWPNIRLTNHSLEFIVGMRFAGGDDVQQLCDAGEDEFLEIMALVGMATKPLHVRRFQKALAEWVNNPAAFQTPLSTSIGEFWNRFADDFNYSVLIHCICRFIARWIQSGAGNAIAQSIQSNRHL